MEKNVKWEFIKETKYDGETIYYTRKNGLYISETVALSEEKGRKLYNIIIERGNLGPVVEVLETKNSNK